MRIKINNRQLARWKGRMLKRYSYVRPAAVSTLNYVGEKTLQAVVRRISAQTGMAEDQVRRHVVVSPASPSKLRYEIDARAALMEATANRPVRGRGFEKRDDTFFKQDELVQIVDMADSRVCEICEAIVEDGPYTIEEARRLIPAHPNCRCIVSALPERRTVRPEMRQRENFRAPVAGATPQEAMGELLTKMRAELSTAMQRAA